jgi:hypothetical protein
MVDHHLYQFLGCCARAECHESHYEQLRQGAAKVRDWDEVAAEAERHGVAPLLYFHLKAAGVHIPLRAKRQLQGLTVRHRAANQVRLRLLHNILEAYQSAGIPALVLKGAALSQLVYPEPGLRPMSDLDLLVLPSQARRAQQVLADLGFHAPPPNEAVFSHRHFGAATRCVEEILVAVEIHHQLVSTYRDNARAYVYNTLAPILGPNARFMNPEPGIQRRASRAKALDEAALLGIEGSLDRRLSFSMGNLTAYTLNYEDTLGYLCWHLTSHVNVWDFGRLIWVADAVSFAEHFAAQMDWKRIARRFPAALDTLALLHWVTPLSDELLGRASIQIGGRPRGIGMEYRGWPRTPLAGWRGRGYGRVLRDTLCPPEWWLRLCYQLGATRPLFWCRWLRHPLHLAGHIVRVALERLGWPTPRELAGGRTSKKSV